jgi:hypothetical protein
MNLQTIEPFITIIVLWGASHIDFTNQDTLLLARVLYGVTQVMCLVVTLLCLQQVKAKNNTKTIRIPVQPSLANPNPAADETVEKTIVDYDTEECYKELKQFAFAKALLIPFIHYKWDTATPLILQIATTPFHLYKSHLVQDHLLKNPVPRPFPAPSNPLGDMFKQFQAEPANEQANNDPEPKAPKTKKSTKVD